MNTNEIYRTIASGEVKPIKTGFPTEELDWESWCGLAQTRVFLSRLQEQIEKLDNASELLALAGDEKQLRGLIIEKSTLKKVLNLTHKGKYASNT